MDFALTEEQCELATVTRSFLEDKATEEHLRILMEEDGFDATVWRQMARQLGLHGLAIPEELGGAGCGFVELGVVLKEMGRVLHISPFFGTVVLGANILLHCGNEEACARYLPQIAAGDLTATLAIDEGRGSLRSHPGVTTATQDSGGWSLSGRKVRVLDGHRAGLIIVVAGTSEGTGLFAVEGDATGLARTVTAGLDHTRTMATLHFERVPAQLLCSTADASAAVTTVLDLAAVALAAEQVGGAQRCLEMSVEYAKQRRQFGREIGSFQAVKHMCAEMLLDVTSAEAAVDYALWAATQLDDELPALASMTRALSSEVYSRVAATTIQVHGGIGFTWEHPAHLYLRRAKASELIFGTPDEHRELLMQRLGV